MCKHFLENKYHVLFKIIDNNGVYNPLQIIKNRTNDMVRERSDHSLGPSEKFNGGSSNGLNSNRIKPRGSLLSRKGTSIWDVSHMENEQFEVHPNKQIACVNSHEAKNEVDKNFDNKMASEQKHLFQIFIPPTQETQAMIPHEEKGSSDGQSKKEKHSRTSSLNSITAASQEKDEPYNKSKRWSIHSIHLFKRKDKKHKNESNLSDAETIKEVPYDSLTPQMNTTNASDLSSGDQTSRSSLEDGRCSSEKGKDSQQQLNHEDKAHNNEGYYESGSKHERVLLKLSVEKHNHDRVPVDDWPSRRNSVDTSTVHSNNSSTINSDLESVKNIINYNVFNYYFNSYYLYILLN